MRHTSMLQIMPMSDMLKHWLLACQEPWVVYNARVDLLGQPESAAEVQSAYTALKNDSHVATLLTEVAPWPQERRLGKAYDPKDSLWKLAMLADFGLKRDDERIATVAEQVLEAHAPPPAPPGFLHGGFDHTKSWDYRPYICISHVMTYALARFGYLDDPRLQRAYDYLCTWQRLDGGWHPNEACLPGGDREHDPSCPFGTVNVLRAVSVHSALKHSEVAHKGIEHVLMLWERRNEPYRPVGFGMGSTFQKLQYPFVQHQILKTVDTLSNFDDALDDARFSDMLDTIVLKQDQGAQFTASAVNKPYADFDFGQKKTVSPWITFLVTRTRQRLQQRRERLDSGQI